MKVDIEKDFSFVAAEHEVLKFWQANQTFEKTLEKNSKEKPYIFYDGPPFATGLPHHGHLVGSTLKDIIPRYFTMKGFWVDRRFGWDCHGLPVEHEIDKKLGISAQEAVAKMGVAGYNQECRSIVQKYTTEWQKTIQRIGRWVSFERDYKTMDFTFMESVWWAFKQLWDKNLVYQSTKVMPFSTALGTVLSNFEAGSNYQDVQDPAVTVAFEISGEDNLWISAWTTTPWTLPSNLALCLNSKLEYVVVKWKNGSSSKRVVLAKDRVEGFQKRHDIEIESDIDPKTLVGKTYEPLFPYFKDLASEGAFQILDDQYVSADNGTGIVHQAPAFGEDDERVVKAAGIQASVCPVDVNGRFTSDVTDFAGQYVKDADKNIIKNLKERQDLLEQNTIVHSYPFCPRSNTPLIYRSIPSWYINVQEVKKTMLASNQQINWVPEHIKEGRFGKWLEGARDWAVSRNRVWGTPIPIWYNEESQKHVCIGSREELAKLADLDEKELTDLHREFVDEIEFQIEGEPGVYKRIPEVLDCWFESGSMPYAQLHYPFENQDIFKKGFPAEFIAEGLDQTRGWFYTLTVLGAALHGGPAFKNVIVNGLVLAEDGKKMSKSLRNFTPPDDLMEEFGADALRLFLINSPLVRGDDLRFSDEGVKDMVRRVLLPWLNGYKFFKTYASVDEWTYQTEEVKKRGESDHVLDRWILSQLESLTEKVNQEMDSYRLYNVVPELLGFIDDLTNWYIRLNRKRFWGTGKGSSMADDKYHAYSTLYSVLLTLNKLMAPITPFLTEILYQDLKSLGGDQFAESIHLEEYPNTQKQHVDKNLEVSFQAMKEVILLGRQIRVNNKVKVKIPLSEIKIISSQTNLINGLKRLEAVIKTELNVKNVNYDSAEHNYIDLSILPNAPVLGKQLGKKFGQVNKTIRSLKPDEAQEFVQSGELRIEDLNISINDCIVRKNPKEENAELMSGKLLSTWIDCKVTPELAQEGLAREVINRIQKSRKEIDLKVDQRIRINFKGTESIVRAIETHKDMISTEVLADNIELKDSLESDNCFSADVEGEGFEFEVLA